MFKSVFTKYIITFMLIITISFAVLAAIVSTMVSDYNNESNYAVLCRTAKNICAYVQKGYEESGEDDFSDFIVRNRGTLLAGISTLALVNPDLIIYVVDSQGNLLLYDRLQMDRDTVSHAIMDNIRRDGSCDDSGTLDGFLTTRHLTYGYGINLSDGRFVCAVFASLSYASLTQLLDTMLRTILMACLWVMLATLIAVYFISERVVEPLKDMVKAAKSFAAGKFDVRVPVVGHDEVSELATAFNQMAGSLENLEKMRRSFLANVSHDLRSPMTTISGFIEGILDGAIPPDKQSHYLNVIQSEVQRLSRLVSTLLDIARIQGGERKFNMVPFDICEMARQILLSFEQRIDNKNLDVIFECDSEKMFVMGDRDAIYQILYNICDNAVKFSRPQGVYRLSVKQKDKKVAVSVYNEGQGIAPEDLPYVFDRFYKSDKSRGLDKTGTGLGLFISKTIIEAHGEKIDVTSEFGSWCQFVFTLPKTHDPLRSLKQRSQENE